MGDKILAVGWLFVFAALVACGSDSLTVSRTGVCADWPVFVCLPGAFAAYVRAVLLLDRPKCETPYSVGV